MYCASTFFAVCLIALSILPQMSNSICELHLTIQADNDFYSLVPHLEQQEVSRDAEHAFSHLLTTTSDQTTGQV